MNAPEKATPTDAEVSELVGAIPGLKGIAFAIRYASGDRYPKVRRAALESAREKVVRAALKYERDPGRMAQCAAAMTALNEALREP